MSSRELPFQTIRVWLVAAVGRENIISRTMPGSAIQWSRIEFSPLISSPCSTIQCRTVSQGTDIYHYTAKCPFQQRPQMVDARFTRNNLNQALPVASQQSCTFFRKKSCTGFLAELLQLYLMTSWSHYKVSWLNWCQGSKLASSKGVFFFLNFEAILLQLCDGVLDHCFVVSLIFYSTCRCSHNLKIF